MISHSNEVDDEDEGDEGLDDEELDPRVQEELERLNSCTDEINQVSINFLHLNQSTIS